MTDRCAGKYATDYRCELWVGHSGPCGPYKPEQIATFLPGCHLHVLFDPQCHACRNKDAAPAMSAPETAATCWFVETIPTRGNQPYWFNLGEGYCTQDPLKAQRYSREEAVAVAAALTRIAPVLTASFKWRATEHVFLPPRVSEAPPSPSETGPLVERLLAALEAEKYTDDRISTERNDGKVVRLFASGHNHGIGTAKRVVADALSSPAPAQTPDRPTPEQGCEDEHPMWTAGWNACIETLSEVGIDATAIIADRTRSVLQRTFDEWKKKRAQEGKA